MAVRKNDALALADELCKAYLAAALKRKSLDDAVPPCMANACQTGRPADVFKQLSKLADAFEDQRTDTFQDVLRRLRFTPRNAYTNFVSVAQSLFQDGIHWGRIVGLYVLGGAVAVECARRNMRGYVELVRGWFMTYVTENLLEWITEHGGWEGFMQFYARRQQRQGDDSAWTAGQIGSVLVMGGLVAAAWAFGK